MLIPFFIFSNFHFYGQELPIGNYCIDYELKDFSTCLTFKSNNEFSFISSGDIGVLEYGSGNFKITNGFLVLDYCKTPLGSLSGYHQFTNWTNDSDKIEIQLNVRDKGGIILPNVNILIPQEKNSSKTDEYGNYTIKLNKSDEFCQIIIRALGFEQYELQIQKKMNYKINIILSEDKDSEGLPIKGQIDNFEVIELNGTVLKLRGKDGLIKIWNKIN